MDAFWMPFTANRDFKADPRIIKKTQGMYCYTDDGREILDGTAGLWCVNAGHSRQQIADAIAQQASTLDYSSPFNFGYDIAFEFANRLVQHTPGDLNRVFFTNSGSEAVESALKIALAYQVARGKPQKQKFIGRDMAYHGVNFGGISVGGLAPNRTGFGSLLPTDHLPHTLDLENNAFSRGLPQHGVEKADALEQLIQNHGAENIAAVIVEPISGAGGVILPPEGYLQRLRELCDQHDILLIFDEVITGWGRVGEAFAANVFDVTPDMITSAKGITNGVVPMGAVFVSDKIHNTVMDAAPEGAIEFYHGYTYSGHPIACAAGLATLDIYEQEGLLTRGSGDIAEYWQNALHSLRDLPQVVDIRNFGLLGAVQFAPEALGSVAPGLELIKRCYNNGIMVRTMGNSLAMSPPLIINEQQIDLLVATIRKSVLEMAA